MPAAKGFNMIYYVEDDDNIRDLTVYALRKQGIEAEGFSCDGEFKAAVARRVPDAVLLDIMLPDTDGLAIMRRLRADRLTATVPIMMLTAKDTELDKVMALDGGADDYLTKPFDKAELLARLQAVVRRSKGHSNSIIRTGDVEVNLDTQTVTVGTKTLHLTGKEYGIMELLSLRKGSTLNKDQFLNHLYGGIDEPELKIIDVFICKLRKKLEKASGGKNYIETVWGRGYVLRDPDELPKKK